MSFYASWWEPGFLNESVNLPDTAQSVISALILVYAIIVGIIMVYVLMNKKEELSKQASCLKYRTMVLVLAIGEIITYEFCPEALVLPALSGGFFSLVKIVLLLLYAVLQFMMTFRLIKTEENKALATLGAVNFFFFIAAFFISLIISGLRAVAAVIGMLVVLAGILLIAIFCFTNSEMFGRFVKSSAWFTVCGLGVLCVTFMVVPYYSFGRFVLALLVVVPVSCVLILKALNIKYEPSSYSPSSYNPYCHSNRNLGRDIPVRETRQESLREYMNRRSRERAQAEYEWEEERQQKIRDGSARCYSCFYYQHTTHTCSRTNEEQNSSDCCNWWEE